jgi:DNA oxidative demethylase
MIRLFDSDSLPCSNERLEEGAVLLRGFATSEAPTLVGEVTRIAQGAPFRHLLTPGAWRGSRRTRDRSPLHSAGAPTSVGLT